ncbi:mandelate racemase/muconate lactonizing enzyme family protein [Myxococcota bacterium]
MFPKRDHPVRIQHYRICEVHRTLSRTTGNARRSWSHRSAILVELVDEQGCWGQGEAAPLPGYSPDTFDLNRAALDRLKPEGWEFDSLTPTGTVLRTLGKQLPSSARAARFALETAVLDLMGHRLGLPAWYLLTKQRGDRQPASIPLAALLDADDPAARLVQADEALSQGFGTLKVKLGSDSRDVDHVQQLRRRLGPLVALRLDANRAWTTEQATRSLCRLAEVVPEFVEEPLADFQLNSATFPGPVLDDASVPIALDESLQPFGENETALMRVPRAIRALVLKPTVLGGFINCIRLAQSGQALGLNIIVSHALEGPIAWAAAISLALAVQSPGMAAGLGPHVGLHARPDFHLQTVRGSRLVAAQEPGLGLSRFPLFSDANRG